MAIPYDINLHSGDAGNGLDPFLDLLGSDCAAGQYGEVRVMTTRTPPSAATRTSYTRPMS